MFSRKPRHSRAARQRPSVRRLRFEPLEDRRLLAAYTVTTAANDGEGSLRAAIAAVNANAFDSIIFEGSFTISLESALEPITRSTVTINGGENTIVIDGTEAGESAVGLTIHASGCTIENLTIQAFDGAGIRIASTTTVDADNNRVENNVISGNGVRAIAPQ